MIKGDRTEPNIGVISSYLPTKCGIATFTKDLCDAIISSIDLTGQIKIIAMTDIDMIGDFDDRVIYKIQRHNQMEYISAAEFLNQSNIDLVILQHEYGLYGGECGEYIIKLLENLRIPIITTLHTVLFKPSAKQKRILQKITALSSKIIIMNQLAEDLLIKQYSIFPEKISFIPHGIHDIPFVDDIFYKDELGLEANRIILTFGFLSPRKGIEIVIEAMSRIIEKYKNVVFIVVGQTHPNIIKSEGETYRNSLLNRVKELHLENHIIFHNKFVDLAELIKYLSAADIYLSPYINEDQITSGTLSYALGTGKAVISTPYFHAKELLAENRGILVPFKNPDKIADAVIELFSSDLERNKMRKRAYQFSRSMVWSKVARMYINLFKQTFTDYHNINVISKPKFP